METPILTTMVVLYNMGVRVDTDVLVNKLPLNEKVIKIEKQGVLKRGESSKDRIRRRRKPSEPVKRSTGFAHNSITLVLLSSGTDKSLRDKEITVKIFQNGVFHITGVLDEKYDRDVTQYLQKYITESCPEGIVSGEWTPNNRRVVLMNYKTLLTGITDLSRDMLYKEIRNRGFKTNYEPDVHSAVNIYFPDKRWIAKVFRTGKVTLTGIVSHDECAEFVTSLNTLLTPFISLTQNQRIKT